VGGDGYFCVLCRSRFCVLEFVYWWHEINNNNINPLSPHPTNNTHTVMDTAPAPVAIHIDPSSDAPSANETSMVTVITVNTGVA
jgi:hypothetical protein